jgi:DNA-binding IclR family transcriptional regulator
MSERLPPLSDREKERLCQELEVMGLLRRDPQGRRWLTERGNYVGMALYAFKMLEERERALPQ